jgi:hypothetical protein
LKNPLFANLIYLLGLLLLGGYAVFSLKESTPHGLGLVNDSFAYLGGADSLLSGNGYSRLSGGGEIRPITHFPPAFSIWLAGASLTGLSSAQAAYLSILALFGLNAALTGLSLYLITQSKVFSLIGALLFAVNALFLRVHSFAMSEPLYLFLSLAGFILIALSFRRRRACLLFAAGLLLGAAALTRFVGLASIASTLLVIVLASNDWNSRIRRAAIFSAAWLPLVLGWLLRNRIATGYSVNRQFGWHPGEWEKYQVGIDRLWNWLLPDRVVDLLKIQQAASSLLLGILALFLIAVIVYAWNRRLKARENSPHSDLSFSLWLNHGIYVIVYLGAVAATITFLDASTFFENRILAPALASLLILLVSSWYWLWKLKVISVRLVLAAFILVFAARFISDGRLTVQNLRKDGQGYSAKEWRASETMALIRDLPEDMIIYTNEPTGVYLLTGRGSYSTPSPWDPVILQPRAGYADDLSRMKQAIQDGAAVLFIFSPGRLVEPQDKAWYEDLKSGLVVSKFLSDSEMYGWLPLSGQ